MSGYETVIGLEIHVELKTRSKIFCGCSTKFGAEPNTQCCPVCMGMPGALPVLNRRAVEYAVVAGLALGCEIAPYSRLDRKNYFYPDLPKAYQISQHNPPLCSGGLIAVEQEGGTKRVGITRVHIEEDAGKLIHTDDGTFIDYNRCGVPLIEIVTGPDLRSGDEARLFLHKLRSLILYTGISDCKMNEGSLRCDVNLSVRKPGEPLGTRTEIKNLNSFAHIVRAIEYESARQADVLRAGGLIAQETRRYDESAGVTRPMRLKETEDDYRYFPDPDLVPIVLSRDEIAALKARLPALPDERKRRYIEEFSLSPYCAGVIASSSRATADFFEKAARLTAYPAFIANMIQTDVLRLMGSGTAIPLSPARLARLADLLGDGRINSSAGREVLAVMWEKGGDPEEIASERKLWQISERHELEKYCRAAIDANPAITASYKKGKESALHSLIGQVMKMTGGRCNPSVTHELLKQLLG